VVTQTSGAEESSLIGYQTVDWRKVLTTGYCASTVEISSPIADISVPAGVLSLLYFLPFSL
jgi:hypothetical protein